MISQPKNRVQAIKSRFENFNSDNQPLIRRDNPQLSKHNNKPNDINESAKNPRQVVDKHENECDFSEEYLPKPNQSYLYSKSDVKISLSDSKSTLIRQVSDPGKKLHRSHAFRCDRSTVVTPTSPKRYGSCYGRSETSEFGLKMGEKRLSKDRLKKLGNVLEDQMRKENFVCHTPAQVVGEICELKNSIPDSEVPQHILEQYAQVLKPKKRDDKQDTMTDSGVSSETENLEDDRSRIKLLRSHFEKTDPETVQTNLTTESMTDLCASSETIKLVRKNPNLILTDTLKKALKQPLPSGPPPKKPPRTFAAIQEKCEPKKDPKKMLEKLEQVLQKREEEKSKNMYDIPETNLSKPKEVHYLCTEIFDIKQRTLPASQNNSDMLKNCFNSLNCAIVSNSMSSLPYTRLSSHSNRESLCACSKDFTDAKKRLSTFSNGTDEKCQRCQQNDEKHDEFKCHLNCKCKMSKSEFFLPNEHIYDVPNVGDYTQIRRKVEPGQYGSLNGKKGSSKSMEDLRIDFSGDQKIYDIPCEISRPATPEYTTSIPKIDFQKLRENFENLQEKKPMIPSPKPILKPIQEKGSDGERKFATEVRRYKRKGKSDGFVTSPRRCSQIDEDKENLNRLMNEIYDTVTAFEKSESKMNSFPTEQEGSEDAVKLTRSLTEKRKNYVRRVSSKVAYLDKTITKQTRFRHQTSVCSYKSEVIDNPYSTFRSWKSFRVSQKDLTRDKMERNGSADSKSGLTDSKCNLTDSSGNLLSMKDEFDVDKLSIDGKMGCVDIELPYEHREGGLFDVCMLVGLNHMTGEAYVKSVFPSQVRVPPHIENLVFPETMSSNKMDISGESAQCYSLVLTDERGERAYGYCRRVLPEGATTCLPLCYCLIGRYRAPGFYYKVLQEIESHHGSSEVNIQNVMHQLLCSDLPPPGEEVAITRNGYSDIVDLNVSRRDTVSEGVPDSYDLQNNNHDVKRFTLDASQVPRTVTIKRPIEPRLDEENLSILLDSFGTGLVIKVFGSLLLERKVVVISDKLSVLSSCMEALQTALYPFVWQQPLISTIPSHIHRDVLEAPLPILAGMLKSGGEDLNGVQFEEGILIDLTHPSKVLFYQGDESTILPTTSYKSLKNSFQMELIKQKDKNEDSKTRNVLISETFLRFFVDILGDFWKCFSLGIVNVGDLGKDGVVFDKEQFIKNASSKQNQYFLEWFTETAMFNHFIQNMAVIYHTRQDETWAQNATLVDTPLPDFYELFEARVNSRGRRSSNCDSKNYKSAVNKKVRLLKNKLRELVA